VNVQAKFEVRSFTYSWDNGDIGVLGGVANPQSWTRAGRMEIGDGTVRKSVGEFLQAPYSNFSYVFTRFRDIAAFELQLTTFPHPSSISSKFPHVSLKVGGWPLGYEERRC